MIGHGNTALEYDINGIRQKKYFYDNDRVHVYYTEDDRIHKEVISENGATTKTLKYFYDESGICGMSYNEQNYFFHKNAFGDVVRIYGSDALLVAEYVYDAWGNHKIYAPNGQEITDATHIANLNPFRYRGYYYDTDMQLYYLNSRYYSPRACRFVSADDIDVATDNYLSTLNGLNLYTYCLNNPIMYTDPSGHLAEWLWKLIIGTSFILIGALVTAATAGAMTSFWAVFGSALLSSAMQVGTSVAIGVAVNGIVNLSNGNNFFDNIGDTIASSYMWGGILSGASQLLSGGFRFLRAKTGFKGLNTAKVGLLSADGLHFKKAGMTIFRFGRRKGAKLAFDFGRYGIHAHIFSDLHIPMIPFIVGLFEAL